MQQTFVYCRIGLVAYFSTPYQPLFFFVSVLKKNKKHLKNVGPIHHNEPPHAYLADVASGTVARRLRIDVYDIDNDDNDDDDNNNA